jgi:predicted ArsR family transcriptional regulator
MKTGLDDSMAAAPSTRSAADGRTRDVVVRLLLERGPTTTAALADELGLSAPAVRRHLDALVADGSVTTRPEPAAPHHRGRGRPARQHLLTASGRARAGRDGNGAADLAVAALRQLAEIAGEESVREFARRRVASLVGPHHDAVRSRSDRSDRVAALAGALSSEGYAASSRPALVNGQPVGEQLCQHHCPVAHVAAEFPQLCEAETEMFAEMLGTHVQRLSTIARGDAACTTHVPVRADAPTTAVPTTTASVSKGRQVV